MYLTTKSGKKILLNTPKEDAQITAAAQAFRSLRAFLTWCAKIEAWVLSEAGIKFAPGQAGLRAVKSGK